MQHPVSTFDKEREDSDDENKRKIMIKETIIDDDEPDYIKDDPLGASRKHSWVLV